MGKVYDDWERLVEAVLRREKIRQLCHDHSRTPSNSSSDSTYQLDDDGGGIASLHLQATMAMVRLQEELIYTLTQNQQCFDHGYVPLRICEENHIYEESIVSVKHDSVQNASRRESSSTETEEYVLDLLHPDMIPQIKSIANIMFASRYDQEFCQAFIGFGRCAFTVYMKILNVEELSIEDVLKMEWKCLNSRIRKWGLAMKNFIGLYLANAKHLFDQVLGEYGHISLTCLIEASKASVMCLLNFGHAVAIGPHRPEWLYCLLDMYEVLAALIPDVDALFPEDIGSFIRIEFYDLLTRLADSAKVIFKELENYIGSISSTRPWANGGIHPLTKYVINYILCFAEYDDTINLLLEEENRENLHRGPM
ncbi:hypothetical protein Pfo_020472 [Paulownia fortunei]|nr:hypothetical protein Pfo_020472 [Paulownia fortunei]